MHFGIYFTQYNLFKYNLFIYFYFYFYFLFFIFIYILLYYIIQKTVDIFNKSHKYLGVPKTFQNVRLTRPSPNSF